MNSTTAAADGRGATIDRGDVSDGATAREIAWSIGDVSRETGLPIETLRFYDRTGLLGELPRTVGGHRVFDRAALGLLEVVLRLRRTQMPVEEVREFVARVRADTDHAGRISLLKAHRERVRRQLEQLTGDLAVIDWKIAAYTAIEEGRESPPAASRPNQGHDVWQIDGLDLTVNAPEEVRRS